MAAPAAATPINIATVARMIAIIIGSSSTLPEASSKEKMHDTQENDSRRYIRIECYSHWHTKGERRGEGIYSPPPPQEIKVQEVGPPKKFPSQPKNTLVLKIDCLAITEWPSNRFCRIRIFAYLCTCCGRVKCIPSYTRRCSCQECWCNHWSCHRDHESTHSHLKHRN